MLFDDGDHRSVKESDLIKHGQLSVGQSVMVESKDGYYDTGIIMGHCDMDGKADYIVERDSGVTDRYEFERMYE